MDLQDYRKELDTLDSGLLELFCRRMEIAAQIGAYKKENGKNVDQYERLKNAWEIRKLTYEEEQELDEFNKAFGGE